MILKHGIVHRAQNTLFGYQGWPSVAVDENGNLYAAASAFRVRHVCPFGKTALYFSKNQGQTWSPPVVINDTYLDDRDAGVLCMGHGRMLVSWFTHSAETYLSHYAESIKSGCSPMEKPPVAGMLEMYSLLPEEEQAGGSYVRISEDGGFSWSEKIRVPVSAPHGPVLASDGSLLYLGKEFYQDPDHLSDNGRICLYRSTDGGYTWQFCGVSEKPADLPWSCFHEPHIAELPDGRLYGMIRAQGAQVDHGFTIYDTVSEDRGCTWSPWRCLHVSGSPPHLLVHSSGALVCVFGRREKPFGERAMISYDGGRTWGEEITLDDRAEDGDLGYPATAELPDGSLLTVYYQKYYDDDAKTYDPKCSVLYTHWTLPSR